MGAMFSPAAMTSEGQGHACHVSALCIGGVRRALVLSSASGILQLLFVLQLLLKPKFSGVEKIKTIGSTYMAAAGLSAPSGHENQVPQAYHLLKVVCQGAEAFCGIAWRHLVGTEAPSPQVCVPSVKAAWTSLCNPCSAGPGAEARAHRCLGGI